MAFFIPPQTEGRRYKRWPQSLTHKNKAFTAFHLPGSVLINTVPLELYNKKMKNN